MLRAKVDLTAVDRGFDAMTRAARDLGPAFKAAKAPVRKDQRDHAKTRQGPDGPWAPKGRLTLAREALARKRAGGRRRMSRRILGRLPGAVKIEAGRNRIVARSKSRWSGVHQDGGTAGRGARIPARPFLWVSDALEAALRFIFERHILGRW